MSLRALQPAPASNRSRRPPTKAEAARELLARRGARAHMAGYIEYLDIGITPAKHHLALIEYLEAVERGDIPRLMIFLPPGSAKALALDTPIPTADGWKMMGELRVGDRVFDENGNLCNVTRVSEIWNNRPVFRVITDCGDEIVADADHEWLVRLCGKPRKPLIGSKLGRKGLTDRDNPMSQFKIKGTRELCRKRSKRPMIMRCKALSTPTANLPIDPYLLGLWLGDGNSTGMRITSSDEDRPWIIGELNRIGYSTSHKEGAQHFGVLGVRKEFVRLGLINDPAHSTYGRKHIPDIYMRAGIEQRLSLLQGLIDSDGTVCKKRGCTTFCNTNQDLAAGVQEIARSLGVKAGLIENRAMLYGKDCGPAYRVSFYLKNSARLPRKKILTRNQKRTPNTYIDVEEAGRADTVCISVDSDSHLFLCGRSMTPTHNSTYASMIFPAWYLGRHPQKNVIAASHSAELAERFGRRVRGLYSASEHQRVFNTGVSKESAAAGRWSTSAGGEYFAAGAGAGIAGFRADLGIIDDPFRNREDADSATMRDKIWDWYKADFFTRLKPGAAQILIQTRWHTDDLAGRLLNDQGDGGQQWHVLSIPMECTSADDPLERKIGERLWPEWFTDEMVAQAKRDSRNWAALYQQSPVVDGGNILKRSWWREWKGKHPPKCVYVIQSYDTAFSDKDLKTNSFSARTTWGVFFTDDGNPAIMLIEAWRGRVDYPTLRAEATKAYREQQPDCVLIEKKASGQSLIQDMRRAGIPVAEYQPDRDKVSRAYAVQALLENGQIYYPPRRWADAVITECEQFPNGVTSDYVDTCTQAWLRIRNSGLLEKVVKLATPDEDDLDEQRQQRARGVYG